MRVQRTPEGGFREVSRTRAKRDLELRWIESLLGMFFLPAASVSPG